MTIRVTYSELLRRTIHALAVAKGRAPESAVTAEAETLVMAAFGKAGLSRISRQELYARGADKVPEKVPEEVARMAEERAKGKPLQYITGEQAFLDHLYKVTPDVLIPRPETEALVTHAFSELSSPVLGLEIGLGSGIISIELLARFPALQMIASEASSAAIHVAQSNASSVLGPGANRLVSLEVREKIQVCEPLLERLAGARADFLISNPPYLAGPDEAEEQVSSHEPALALWSPAGDPVYFYRAIARDAKELIADHAPVLVEIPHERAAEIRGVFATQGWGVTLKADLTGRDRVLIARRGA